MTEPRWQSSKETWSEFQCRHFNWNNRQSGTCEAGSVPANEGKQPKQSTLDILLAISFAVLAGGPTEMLQKPSGVPVRPPSPMDVSPAPSRPASPKDTSPTPAAGRPDGTTADRPADSAQGSAPSASHAGIRGPNPYLSPNAVPRGMHINEVGMLEKSSFSTVYRVERPGLREEIAAHGFSPSNHFGGIQKMIQGDAIIVSETPEGARIFGNGEYGEGHYDLYAIDAKGYKGASLKDNVDYNTEFVAHETGRTAEALKKLPPREVAEGALEFIEAHIDAAAGQASKVHLLERGVPRDRKSSDSE
ncbi:hypothetical protein [Burkholderia sp. 9120]|uniref:hypothetical protein n=1 Tax=Burkholderia sp. 9120 TaxID=1500897 RepID=UPI0012E0813B|nr:hypothetical protein [Burkholderia sp. 9120]